jgi:hypothetical protein
VATKFKVGEMVTVVDNFYLDTFCNKVLIVVAYDSGSNFPYTLETKDGNRVTVRASEIIKYQSYNFDIGL